MTGNQYFELYTKIRAAKLNKIQNSGKLAIFGILFSQNVKFWSKINLDFRVFARIQSPLAGLHIQFNSEFKEKKTHFLTMALISVNDKDLIGIQRSDMLKKWTKKEFLSCTQSHPDTTPLLTHKDSKLTCCGKMIRDTKLNEAEAKVHFYQIVSAIETARSS